LDNVDLLRALAIVSVVAWHYTGTWPGDLLRGDPAPFRVPYGWAGVDLFFMVSGYCIFMTLERSRTLAGFWARRFARLQPAYMLAVLLTFAVVSLFGLPGHEASLSVALGNLVWFDIHPGWGFVDDAYWSLVVELEFYFCFGLIYFLVRGRQIALAWGAFAAVGSALIHAEAWGWPQGHALSVLANSVMVAPFAPAFLVGVIAYEWREGVSVNTVAAVVLAIGLIVVSPRYQNHPWLGLAVGAFASIVFRLDRMQLPRALTFVGLISYSLYLIHQFIGLVIIRELAPAIPALLPRAAIAAAIVTALASAMFLAVELRWQRSLARLVEPVLAVLTGWSPRLPRGTPPATNDLAGDQARRW
jgi:peptidoglycan/LPS O-acetylase OafA/YrhL